MGSGARLSTLRRSSGSVQDNSSFGGAAGGGSSWGAGRGSDAGTGGGGGSTAGSGVSGVEPSPAASPSPPPAAAPAAAPSGDRDRARIGGDREAPFSGGMLGVDDGSSKVGESGDGSKRAGEGSGGGEDDGAGGGRKRPAAAMEPGSEDVGEPPLQSRRYAEDREITVGVTFDVGKLLSCTTSQSSPASVPKVETRYVTTLKSLFPCALVVNTRGLQCDSLCGVQGGIPTLLPNTFGD